MAQAQFTTAASTVDPAEVERFARLASEWWNPDGKFRPLHKFNPVRLSYLRDQIARHFDRDIRSEKPFSNLRLLDIGCGGGLICEPMARLGASVVGADPARANIEVAKLHAEASRLDIDYRATTAEELAAASERFDVVLALEVIEHVADRSAFIAACAELLRPDGILVMATINRTLKAYALAIVGAEVVLRWLPRGTHEYSKLVQPRELETWFGASGLALVHAQGISYNPLTDSWNRSGDLDVNYMMVARRSGTGST